MKNCDDFAYTNVECCGDCHMSDNLREIKVDGELVIVCCYMERFFYPSLMENLSPEERLLRAIFGEHFHPDENWPLDNDPDDEDFE
jgi:hypothetical protein